MTLSGAARGWGVGAVVTGGLEGKGRKGGNDVEPVWTLFFSIPMNWKVFVALVCRVGI